MQTVQSNSSDKAALTPAQYNLTKSAYTIDETLALLPIGRTTLWELMTSGELPVMRFGRRVSIAAADLADLLNKRRHADNPGLQSSAA